MGDWRTVTNCSESFLDTNISNTDNAIIYHALHRSVGTIIIFLKCLYYYNILYGSVDVMILGHTVGHMGNPSLMYCHKTRNHKEERRLKQGSAFVKFL